MLRFWLYVIVLAILCVIGLTIGSANDVVVDFDFIFVKAQLSLAMVFVIGLIVGILIGLYLALLICLKFYMEARKARSELKHLKKSIAKDQKQQDMSQEKATEVLAASDNQ